MTKLAIPFITLILCCGTQAQAQFGGLLPKKESKPASSSKVDADALIAQGATLIAFTTLATDLGYQASLEMLNAFPAAKVEKIRKLSEKVNEAKAKRSNKDQMDASEVEAISAFEAAMAELDQDWKSYQKDKAKAVVPAYAKEGLMIAADAVAATQIKGFIESSQAAIDDLKSNPMQLTKVKKLTAMAATLSVLSKQIPEQTKSAVRIQTIASKIAKAEGFKLGEAPKVTSSNPEDLKKLASSAEVAG